MRLCLFCLITFFFLFSSNSLLSLLFYAVFEWSLCNCHFVDVQYSECVCVCFPVASFHFHTRTRRKSKCQELRICIAFLPISSYFVVLNSSDSSSLFICLKCATSFIWLNFQFTWLILDAVCTIINLHWSGFWTFYIPNACLYQLWCSVSFERWTVFIMARGKMTNFVKIIINR